VYQVVRFCQVDCNIKMQLRRIWDNKMAVSDNQNISALGRKISLQGKAGKATSKLGNAFWYFGVDLKG